MSLLLAAALIIPARARAEACDPGNIGACVPKDIDVQRPLIMKSIREGLGAESTMRRDLAMKQAATSAGDERSELIAWTAAKSDEQRMNDAFDRAIALTEQAYRLTPEAPDDPRAAKPASADGAWCAGIRAPWSPQFQLAAYRAILGSDKQPHYVSDDPEEIVRSRGDPSNDGGVAAVTDPDGRTTIFLFSMEWSVFADDPGFLASAIHHEARHYAELIGKGWDTHEQGEIRANTASLAGVDLLIPETSQNGRFELRKMVKGALQSAITTDQRIVDAGHAHSPFATGEQEKRYAERVDEQRKSEQDYLALKARIEARERDEQNRLEDARRSARWMQFQAWTLAACQYIDGVHEADPEWGEPDRIQARGEYLRDYLRSHLVVLPPAEIDDGLRRNDLYRVGALGACQEQMIGMFRGLPGPVDVDWIMSKIEYERNGGRVGEIISRLLKSVAQAVSGGAAAIVETVTTPFVADRGSSDGGSTGDSGSGREDRDRSWQRPDVDKPPYQQLRGVAAHGW